MVHYMGSKARHAADIIAIATADRKQGQPWIEPFVGGGNVICRVPPEQGSRIGNDLNWRMIALLDALGNKGWLPPETMTEDEFNKILDNPDDYPPELVAFTATGPTFGSVWMGPWAKDYAGKEGTRYRQARDAAIKDIPGLRDIKFTSMRYEELPISPCSIVYCDPPYAETSGYANLSTKRSGARTTIEVGQDLTLNAWSRIKFWKWADALVDAGHSVYVSEYTGPPPSIYHGMTPELQAESMKLLEQGKAIDADPKATKADRMALRARLADVDKRIKTERERLAARWMPLWEKKVVSDFHSEREAGVKSGKVEIEKLFHRKA